MSAVDEPPDPMLRVTYRCPACGLEIDCSRFLDAAEERHTIRGKYLMVLLPARECPGRFALISARSLNQQETP